MNDLGFAVAVQIEDRGVPATVVIRQGNGPLQRAVSSKDVNAVSINDKDLAGAVAVGVADGEV